MKKQLLLAVLSAAALTASAEGKLIKSWNCESPRGIQVWPAGTTLELDEEIFHQGKKSLVFTPDNNCCVYFWYKVKPNNKYSISFYYKTAKAPIARCGATINFKTADGKTISQHKPLADVCTADDQWHEAKFEFTAPDTAVNAQVMLAFFRCNTEVFIDEFKFFDESVQINKQPATDLPAPAGTLFKTFNLGNPKEFMKWPDNFNADIQKDAALNKDYLAFSAANNGSLYSYLRPTAGKTYTVQLLYKASGDALKRCGFTLFFTSKGGKRGDLATKHIPLTELTPSNGSWTPATFSFTVPEKTSNMQFMINLYRLNVDVDIADIKIYQQ